MTRIWWNLTRTLDSLKSLHFHLFLSCKVFNVWPKKNESERERSYLKSYAKFVKKTDLWFGKRHEEYGKLSPEHLNVSKLGLWWYPLIQSRKGMSLNFTEELCHDNEEWCKIWRGTDLSLQNWHDLANICWSWRRLEDMSSRYFEDISWRRLEYTMERNKILTWDICI